MGVAVNIFASFSCPTLSAVYLDDKRVVKMCVETCQILSTAVTESGGHGWYRPTHQNHPCCVWARASRANYEWLVAHFIALLNEYTARYQRVHACEAFKTQAISEASIMPSGGMTPFVDCTRVEPTQQSIHERYRECLRRKWANDKRTPTWFRHVDQRVAEFAEEFA